MELRRLQNQEQKQGEDPLLVVHNDDDADNVPLDSSSTSTTTVLKTESQMIQMREYIKHQYDLLNPRSQTAYDTRLFRFINMIFNRINANTMEQLIERARTGEDLALIPLIPRILSECGHAEAEASVANAMKANIFGKACSKYLRLTPSSRQLMPAIPPKKTSWSSDLADKKKKNNHRRG